MINNNHDENKKFHTDFVCTYEYNNIYFLLLLIIRLSARRIENTHTQMPTENLKPKTHNNECARVSNQMTGGLYDGSKK